MDCCVEQCCQCQKPLKRNYKTISCVICKMKSCISCTNLSKNQSTKYACHPFYYSKNCIREIFPFQSVDNIEFESLMQVPNHISKLLNKASETQIDWPDQTLSPTCKYKSVEWLSKNYSKSHSSTLDFIHFNVRSLPKNKKNIEELLPVLNLTKKPDIIAITETKLNDNNIAKTQLKDSDLINCNSLTKAGGVALCISNSLMFNKIEKLSVATTHYKSLFIEINVKNKIHKNLVIGVFYRHPSAQF